MGGILNNDYNFITKHCSIDRCKIPKGAKKQCKGHGILGVGNHISYYLLPIINTIYVDDKK